MKGFLSTRSDVPVISGGRGTAAEKMLALGRAGIRVCESPAHIGAMVAQVLG